MHCVAWCPNIARSMETGEASNMRVAKIVAFTARCSVMCVLLCHVARADDDMGSIPEGDINAELRGSKDNTATAIYKKLFKHQRAAQVDAAKKIVGYNDYEKQYKMISKIFERLFKMLADSKLTLIESGFTPGDPMPTQNMTLRDAYSHVLENTAFFGDIILRLPDVSHKLIDRNKEWQLLIGWGVSFCNETGVFEDANQKMLNLLAQEMNLVERDPSYVNPYTSENKKLLKDLEEGSDKKTDKKDKKKKKEKNRGPRMTGPVHNEL